MSSTLFFITETLNPHPQTREEFPYYIPSDHHRYRHQTGLGYFRHVSHHPCWVLRVRGRGDAGSPSCVVANGSDSKSSITPRAPDLRSHSFLLTRSPFVYSFLPFCFFLHAYPGSRRRRARPGQTNPLVRTPWEPFLCRVR